MSDIVERLRWIGSRTSWESADQQCNEAADEIERLRAEVEALRAALRQYLNDNDTEGFGCACEPNKTCGPCREHERQRPLRAALRRGTEHD